MEKSMSHWTNADVAVLKQSYATEPTTRIARRLDRSVAAIRTKAEELGLSKPRNISEASRCWTDEQISLLREIYPVTPAKDLMNLFNRSSSRIRSKAAELGLHKTIRARHPRPEYLRLYRVNEKAFNCLTPDMTYVLGFCDLPD
jgi:hypothetical protein